MSFFSSLSLSFSFASLLVCLKFDLLRCRHLSSRMRKVGWSRRKSREEIWCIFNRQKNCVPNNNSSVVVEKQEKKRLTDQLECVTIKLPTNQAIKDVPMFLFFLLFFFFFFFFYAILLKILLRIVFIIATRLVLTHWNSSERKR